MTIFIQVGLYTSLDWSYLAENDELKRLHNILQYSLARHPLTFNMLPHSIVRKIGDKVHVVGVDLNPESVEFIANQYSYNKSISTICAAISDLSQEYITHNGWSLKTEYNKPKQWEWDNHYYKVPNMSISDLFDKVLEIDEGAEILGLMLDIEGLEERVISSYDWKIKPSYVVVEVHEKNMESSIMSIMLKNGYKVWEVSDHEELFNTHIKFILE